MAAIKEEPGLTGLLRLAGWEGIVKRWGRWRAAVSLKVFGGPGTFFQKGSWLTGRAILEAK